MPSIQEIVEHQDVLQANKHKQVGSFATKSQEVIYAFWANDQERSKTGELIKHHGKEAALNYQTYAKQILGKQVCLMEDFEGKNNVVTLNEYEKRSDISAEVIIAVCALNSSAYANSANNTIMASVKGASINSFFRTNELPVIMNNPNITKIINVSREDPEGTVYKKKEAYHIMRDEWLEKAIDQYQKINKAYRSKEVIKEVYDGAVNNMSAEIILSQNAFVIKRSNLNLGNEYDCYRIEDQGQELIRLDKCIKLMQENEDLKTRVENLDSVPKETLNSLILEYFNEQALSTTLAQKIKHRAQIRTQQLTII